MKLPNKFKIDCTHASSLQGVILILERLSYKHLQTLSLKFFKNPRKFGFRKKSIANVTDLSTVSNQS